MITVYKYKVSTTKQLPQGARILHVDIQNEEIYMWAMVDNATDVMEFRDFVVVGTGWDLTSLENTYTSYNHLGSIMDGQFVWHVLEVFKDVQVLS